MRRAAGGRRVTRSHGFSLGPSPRLAALLEAVWLLAERAGRRSGGLGNGEHLEQLPPLLVAQPLRLQHFSNRCHRLSMNAELGRYPDHLLCVKDLFDQQRDPSYLAPSRPLVGAIAVSA